MLAQIRPSFAEPAQIDDAPYAGIPCGSGELHRKVTIPVGILSASRCHGVNQVEGCFASRKVVGKRSSVRQVGLADLDAGGRGPGPAGEFPRRANQAPDPIAFVEQARREPASYVAAGPGNRDALPGQRVWRQCFAQIASDS